MSKYFKIFLPLTVFTLVVLLFIKFFLAQTYAERALKLLNNLAGKPIMRDNDTHPLHQAELLKLYYEKHQQAAIAEAKEQAKLEQKMLLEMLLYADSLGLDSKDYHAKYLKDFNNQLGNPNYSYEENLLQSEIVFADAAISFLHDVAYGKSLETLKFNGIEQNIDSNRIANALKQVLQTKQWHNVIDTLEPQIPEYIELKNYYNKLRTALRQYPTLDTAQCTPNNTDLILQKLEILGFKSQNDSSDSSLKNALVKFQKAVSLDTSGKPNPKTIAELNVPLSFRVQQLKQSLNCWRWTGRVAEKSFILVNIPAATLRIIQRDSTTELNMRVIVGKEQTRTPVFTAYITKIITYPYWIPTYSIAAKEILPKVQKDISYLAKNNFTVLDKKGNEIDPYTINWKSISPKNLPYTFRQGTGCDNSLGVIKFDLNSPFSIYLHDTNNRDLFAKNDRHLSHGCIRLEKPFLLANYLLGDTVNTSYLNQCLKTEKPKEIKLKQKFPVLIFYMTADINKQGQLQFFKDVYQIL